MGTTLQQLEAKLSESRASARKLAGRADKVKRIAELEEQSAGLSARLDELRAQRALLTGKP